jgi:hypothetical protein
VKNKKATYLLIALVVFIWGTIVFKIIKHVGLPIFLNRLFNLL